MFTRDNSETLSFVIQVGQQAWEVRFVRRAFRKTVNSGGEEKQEHFMWAKCGEGTGKKKENLFF